MKELEDFEKALRIAIIIFGIILIVLILAKRMDNCDLCKYELKGKNVSATTVINSYIDTCFQKESSLELNFSVSENGKIR